MRDDDEAGAALPPQPNCYSADRNLLRMPVCVQRGGVVGCHSELPAIAALQATAATATVLVLDATGRI